MRPFLRLHPTTKNVTRHFQYQSKPQGTTTVSSLSSQQKCNLTTSAILSTERHNGDSDTLLNRHSLNPSRGENSQSGTDNEVASHDAPFDPSNTAPEAEMEATARESSQRNKQSNPLDVSPANADVNKARDPSEDKAERGVERPPSARGRTRKNKPVN
jgi:hypothetical protein